MTITEMPEKATEGAVMGADLLTGTAVTIADAVTKPTRTARGVERRGAAVNKTVARAIDNRVDDVVEAVGSVMPERVLVAGLRLLKERARRKDLVGDIAYWTLDVVNDGLEGVTNVLGRFERLSEPPVRNGETKRSQARQQARTTTPARRATAAARTTKRTAAKATTKATGTATRTARRGTARARTAERKTT